MRSNTRVNNKKNGLNKIGAHMYSNLAFTPLWRKKYGTGWVDGWIGGWMDEWMDGWVGGWMDGRAGLRIAYSNQKISNLSLEATQ